MVEPTRFARTQEASRFTGGPGKLDNKGPFSRGVTAVFRLLRIVYSRLSTPLVVAGGLIESRKFRRKVIREMRLTVTNLRPDVSIGGTDRRGWYTEIYLNFGDFRLRITRAIYNSGREDLWADIGSTSDPTAFFRMDYVIAALTRLDPTYGPSDPSQVPNTLAAFDTSIWALRTRLAQYLSAANYPETKRTVQQVMHEEAVLTHVE